LPLSGRSSWPLIHRCRGEPPAGRPWCRSVPVSRSRGGVGAGVGLCELGRTPQRSGVGASGVFAVLRRRALPRSGFARRPGRSRSGTGSTRRCCADRRRHLVAGGRRPHVVGRVNVCCAQSTRSRPGSASTTTATTTSPGTRQRLERNGRWPWHRTPRAKIRACAEHGSYCRVVNAVRVGVARHCCPQRTTWLAVLRDSSSQLLKMLGRLGVKGRAIAESGADRGLDSGVEVEVRIGSYVRSR
jgi:hypothetical protein